VDRGALNQLSKDELIALLLAQEARIAELERRLGLPVQYGKRIGAVVLYLLHYQLLPEKRSPR
jgi:hypothetical protein